MDPGEPSKDLPMLEQIREADPPETESSKKMKATTEPTPDTLTATTEMVNATFEVIAPVAVQEQFSPGKMDPFEDVSPPPSPDADKDCVVVHVTRYEVDDLNIRTGKTKFLSCSILEAICTYTEDEMYSSHAVVRRVVQGVLKHNKFKATPSFVRHTVLVKLMHEDDVACLDKHVYEWKGHKVIFKKVDRIELLPDVLDDVHGKVRLVSIPK